MIHQLLLQQEETPTRNSQATRVLNLLLSKEWVTLPEIMDLRIANYRARISELRRKNYNIVNRTERTPDGTLHSFYRIEGRPA